MFAVVFEVLPSASGYQRYLDTAAALRPHLDEIQGFVSIERFRSLTHPGWILSLSIWKTEAALVQWRNQGDHHAAQEAGRASVFDDYRLRVVQMLGSGDVSAAGSSLLSVHEHAADDSIAYGKRFESLVNHGKHIDVWDADAAFAATCPHTAVTGSAWCARVLRDYGLFDRRQAPQVFPEVKRGIGGLNAPIHS